MKRCLPTVETTQSAVDNLYFMTLIVSYMIQVIRDAVVVIFVVSIVIVVIVKAKNYFNNDKKLVYYIESCIK